MARTKSNPATSTEKITTVEVANTTETKEVKTEDVVTSESEKSDVETTETKEVKKAKKFKDDEKVKIKALHRAGKSVIGLDVANPITFDEKGIAETTGKEANRLLTVPGFTLA